MRKACGQSPEIDCYVVSNLDHLFRAEHYITPMAFERISSFGVIDSVSARLALQYTRVASQYCDGEDVFIELTVLRIIIIIIIISSNAHCLF